MGTALLGLCVVIGLVGYQVVSRNWRMTRLRRAWEAGHAALEADKLEEAEAEFRRCVKLEPLFVPARTALGEVLARRDQLAEAEEQLKMSCQLQPRESSGHLHLAHFYITHCNGREADARDAFAHALELDPQLPEKLNTHKGLHVLRDHPQLADLLR